MSDPPAVDAPGPDRDLERLRLFMHLTPEEKLRHLEELNALLAAAMPESSKRAWQELKKQGW